MFIECQTHYDKAVFYNVHSIVFVGENKHKVSLQFVDGSFCNISDEYVAIVKRIIELAKIEISPFLFVQFTTKKEERIAFPVRRIFYILEEENFTAIMFNDGTRIEVIEDYETVIGRIYGKLNYAVERPNNIEETKS